jgi:glycosyltransferase involved in cell wall biosynthesis
VKTENPPASWDRYRREVARGLAAAGLLVCPSRAMLDALRDIYGGAVGESRVIPNGCEPGRFSPGLKGPFVFAAGRLWDEAKNIQALERAAPRLRWPVCIAGEDHHPDGPRASFGRLRFLGRLAARDLARWYARAPIYALPARYEPFGLTVLEAAMAGCALVLGDIPSLRENWRGAAEFVSPNDSDALAAAIDGLIADRDRRARLARRARARAVRFTSQRMADSYLDAYRYLIARGAGASTCPGQAKRPAPPSRLENVRT